MTHAFDNILALVENNKSQITHAANTTQAEKDRHFDEFKRFLECHGVTKGDIKDATIITIDGVKSLQTIAIAFIAIVGSLIQFGFTRGLTWNNGTTIALAVSGVLGIISLYFGFKAIGSVTDSVNAAKETDQQPWPTKESKYYKNLNWWKNGQSILGLLALLAFGLSLAVFPITPRTDLQPVTAGQVVEIKSWKSLELRSGSLAVNIGVVQETDGASLKIQAQ